MRLLLALLLLAGIARGEERGGVPIVGPTFLAGLAEDFPVQDALRMYRRVRIRHTAVEWTLFGQDKEFLRKLINSKAELVVIEIHPTCGPCRRNPGYEKQPAPGALQVLRSIAAFIRRHQSARVIFLVSTELERTFARALASEVVRKLQRIMPPGVETVDNPLPQYLPAPGADYVELHGKKAKCPARGRSGCIADLDGDELHGRELRAWLQRNRHADYARMWAEPWQGIVNGKPVALSRRRYFIPRSHIFEVRNLIREYERLADLQRVMEIEI